MEEKKTLDEKWKEFGKNYTWGKVLVPFSFTGNFEGNNLTKRVINLGYSATTILAGIVYSMGAIQYGNLNPNDWQEIQEQRQEQIISELEQNILSSSKEIFNNIDANNDGVIDMTEYLCHNLNRNSQYEAAQLRDIRDASINLLEEYCSD